MDKPRINAHVSVLFIKEPQEDERDSREQEKAPGGSSVEEGKKPEEALEQAPCSPRNQKASTSQEDDEDEWEAMREKYG